MRPKFLTRPSDRLISQKTSPVASPPIIVRIQVGKSHFLRAELRVLEDRQLSAQGVAESGTSQSAAQTFLFVPDERPAVHFP